MIENYLHTSEQLQAVFLLVDIRHEPSANDKMMYEWMVYQGFTPDYHCHKGWIRSNAARLQKQLKAIREGTEYSKAGAR